MKNKLTIIFGMIFLIGLVTAAGTITNFGPAILSIPEFIAGGTTSTEFSFDYEADFENNASQSLVLRVNVSFDEGMGCSLDDCSVWVGDFQLSGFIEQSILPWLSFETTHPLKCVEETAEFRVQQGILYTETDVPAGTFYCYDPNDYIDMLKLDRRDKVNLSITSNPALYPGNYSMSIELMEMEMDDDGPVIELVEPVDKGIFSGMDEVVPIKLDITDMYNIDSDSVKYKVVSYGVPSDGIGVGDDYYDSGWIYEIDYNATSGLYEADFDMGTHGLTESGSYWIYAEAKDILGNEGKL